MKKPFPVRPVAVLALGLCPAFLLTGCGGGDAAAPATATIEGQVVKGPVQGATVVAYRLRADGSVGDELARTTSAAGGAYTLTVPADAVTVLVQASGGSYDDEAVEGVDSTPLAAPLRSWASLPSQAGAKLTAHLTPLTEAAVRRALADKAGATASTLGAAATAVAAEAGLAGLDLAGTAPVVSGTPNAYGQALVRFARLAKLAGGVEPLLKTYAAAVPGERDVVASVEVPASYRANTQFDAEWFQACVVASGTAQVPEWNASYNYRSYRKGVVIWALGQGKELQYGFDPLTAYYDDADCQRAILLDGDRATNTLTLESLVTLADGTQAVRGTHERTARADQSVSRSKVLLRLNLAEGSRTLDLATSAAGETAYPGADSLRRHTVGYAPADAPR